MPGPTSPPALSVRLTRLRRHVMRHRRLVTAVLVAAVALSAVQVLAPAPPATVRVVVAARDLDGGITLGPDDLSVADVSPDLAPAGSTADPGTWIGRVVAGPMRAREVVTDQRVVTSDLLAGYGAELVGAPLRLRDVEMARLLRVGDHVDVLAATARVGSGARVLAAGAPVVAIPVIEQHGDGALVVLALAPSEAALVAQATATTQVSVVIHP